MRDWTVEVNERNVMETQAPSAWQFLKFSALFRLDWRWVRIVLCPTYSLLTSVQIVCTLTRKSICKDVCQEMRIFFFIRDRSWLFPKKGIANAPNSPSFINYLQRILFFLVIESKSTRVKESKCENKTFHKNTTDAKSRRWQSPIGATRYLHHFDRLEFRIFFYLLRLASLLSNSLCDFVYKKRKDEGKISKFIPTRCWLLLPFFIRFTHPK